MSVVEKAPDPYYQLARKIQGLSRQDLAVALRHLHQHSVDEAVQVACMAIDKTVEDPEVAAKAKNELCDTYIAAGFVSDERKALARTEAILYVMAEEMISEPSHKYILASLADDAQSKGHGIDVSRRPDGWLEIALHKGKYSLK